MFQPSLNENVYRSLLSRVNSIDRSVNGDMSIDDLRRVSNLLQQVYDNASNLRSGLSDEVWSSIDGHCTRLRQLIADRMRISHERLLNVSDIDNLELLQPVEQLPHPPSRNGRPKKGIDKCKLKLLLGMRFTVSDIAKNSLLGYKVHRNTLTNFIKEEGLQLAREKFTTMSDEDLTVIIKELSEKYVNSGYREMTAFLATRSPPIIVQFNRVNRLLRQVDPVGTARRWSLGIQRRSYHVPTANYLWHLDTNHKLIRWNFVVNGCVDGLSRLVTNLGVSTNNLAITALNFFFSSVMEYGVPGRIRIDGGYEFNHVERFMNEIDGTKRCIRGKSVHNQRIERLWRDVFTKILAKYHGLFNHMENHGILNIDNDLHMFALHRVFEPRINNELSSWRNAHNNHALRTEHNKTPLQLWHRNIIIHSAEAQYSAIRNIFDSDDASRRRQIQNFRASHDLVEPNNIGIVLQRIVPPLTQGQLYELSQTIDVHAFSESHGIDIYGRVITFIRSAQEA